jgi:hypothetical protein
MTSSSLKFNAALFRKPKVVLFLLSLLIYAYFYQAGGWNQNTRFDLVRSLVEEGTHKIGSYAYNTGDISEYNGHVFSDKAPGVSWIGVVPYAAFELLTPGRPHDAKYLSVASYLVTVFTIAVPSALAVMLMYELLGIFELAIYFRLLIVFGYAFGTLAFPYSTLLYGHQLATVFLFAAFTLLARRERQQFGSRLLFGSGILLGSSVAIDYSSMLAVIPICCYAAYKSRNIRHLSYLVLGGLTIACVLAAYHTYYFGSPFKTAYDFSIQSNRHEGGFMGIGTPNFRVLYSILISSYRGLFFSAPWLIIGVIGWCLACINKRFIPEALVSLSIVIAFCWLNSSLVDWQGGNAVGPRYLIPILPFLSIGAAGLKFLPTGRTRFIPRLLSLLLVVLIAYSTFMMLVMTSVKPELSMSNQQPFKEILLPSFYQGNLSLNTQSIDQKWAQKGPNIACNLGQLLGLNGLASLAPLGIGAILLVCWLIYVSNQESRKKEYRPI